MLPSKGYFKGVSCPDQSKGGCRRPYCHFRHETRPQRDSKAQASSAFENENADVISTSSNIPSVKNADEELASGSSSDLVSSSSAVENISSNDTVSQITNEAGTMAIQPELIQQLVNAAVQKVIADNPALAAGPVDTATIMQSIDTSAIVAQATQSMSSGSSNVKHSTEQSANEEVTDSTSTDQGFKTKRKLYLRPLNAPAYNPTPIKELEKRKHVMEESDSYSPTPTSLRNRLLDDVIESESNSKGSGIESEATDFSSSSEDEEDKEKRRSEFDLLEEVLAEHSANNKTKVKKKKKKALGKLQYSNSPVKYVDESSLIADAREICENDIANESPLILDARELCENDIAKEIDKTPKSNSKSQVVKEKTDQTEPVSCFLPPSPVFTGNSCDGYNNSGTDYTEPYSSNITSKKSVSKSSEKEKKIDSENVINEPTSFKETDNIECTAIANEKLPITGQSSLHSKEKVEPRKGHALLCQLVQNPVPVTRLSRQNVSAWIPGVKKSTLGTEGNSVTGDLLEAMVSSFDGGISQTPVLSKEKKALDSSSKDKSKKGLDSSSKDKSKKALDSSSKDNDLMPSKLVETKTYKVDLNKEIQSLNNPQESKMLTEGGRETLHKDLEKESNYKTNEIKENKNKNTGSKDNCKENKSQELSAESTAKKHKRECNDYPGSESDIENDDNKKTDKKIKSDEIKNKKGKHKKKKHRSRSDSEIDEESDASVGNEKKKHKKKKKRRNRKKSDSEEENSDEESSDKDQEYLHKNTENEGNYRTNEIKENENKNTSSKDNCKENKSQEISAESTAKKHKKKYNDFSESESDLEEGENKKTDKKIKSDENKNKKGKHKKIQNKKKKHRSRSDSEIDEESDASPGKEKKKHKKKKKRSRKKSDSEEENSDEESSDKDQEKKKRKQKKKSKSFETDESEANTDKENTDKKRKSKSGAGKKDKDKKIREKDDKSHSDSEKEDINKDKLENKTKSSKSQEKVSERKSRSRDRNSEDCHANVKKIEARDRSEEKDKDEENETPKKKRKRSSSSERSSSRNRSSSRKRKKKRRGSKYKKKRGRKHKKRKYSRSNSEESDDDYSDDEEKSEESDEDSEASEEKESNSKEKSKRHKTSKKHKRSSRDKKKSKYKRSRSSSESRSRSSSSSRSHSKNREKKGKDKKESQSKEGKKSTAKSIPMPVDPSKIKEEKIDFVDLTKVKIEKIDDETSNLNRDNIKKNTENMQLICTKTVKIEKNADERGNEKETCKENERINKKSSDIKSVVNENHKLNETKPQEEVDPLMNRKLVGKEARSSTDKERRKSVDSRRGSGDRSKEKNKDFEKSYSKSKYNDRSESNNSKDRVVKENESPSSHIHKVDLDKKIEKLSSKSSVPEKDRVVKENESSSSHTIHKVDLDKKIEKLNSKSSVPEKDRVIKENKSPSSHIHKVDLDKKNEKLSSKSSVPENLSSNSVGSIKNSEGSVKSVPTMSIFDMVLASTAESPTKKVLKEVSIFDAVAASNNDFPSPPSSPDHSPGHLPDSPTFDYNSKYTDPPGTFTFDGIKRRKSSSDEKDTSKEKSKDKDNFKVKAKKESNQKEEGNKESNKSKKEHSKNTHSTEKEKESKSKDDQHKVHRSSSSSSSHRNSKEESKHSSSRLSSKHKESGHSSSSRSSSHSKKKDDSKTHSSNIKHKSEKEADGKSNTQSSSSSHSSKKHTSSSSSSSKTSSTSKKNSSSTSSSTKRKEKTFEDLLNQPHKKLKTEKIKSKSEGGSNKNLDSDDGGDSPMPDLSALDDIEDDDWNQIFNADKPQIYDDYSHLENLKSDDSDEDELADLDDPRVMEECKQMFDDFKPPPEVTIHQSARKERKASTENLEPQIPASRHRIARAPSSGSSSGNLIHKPIHKKPKMTPTQMMMERYKKLKEKAEELNKLVKTQEEQLKKQQSKSSPSDSSTKVEFKQGDLPPSAKLIKPTAAKTRIAHVPNVAGILQARDKIKSVPPTTSRSLLSAQASKASGSVPGHTTAITNAKGAKRIAHTPTTETLARPIVPAEFGSKVPQNVRQRYLNTFIDECLKFCDGKAEAYSKAMAEERVCFNRATSRSIYLNLAVNTIKRLRMKQISEDAQELLLNDPQYSQDNFETQPSTSSGLSSKSRLSHPPSQKLNSMSHPTNPNLRSQSHFTTIATGGNKGSWSIEKVRRTNSEVEKLRGLDLYKHLKKYVLSEEDLEGNGYPRPDPDEKGKAVIKVLDQRKKISPSATERYCDRCNALYVVDKWGFPKSSLQCSHHWGRIYKKRAPGGLTSVYSCCSGDMTSEGCNIASTHVSGNFLPKELRGYVRTLPKSSKDGNFGVYALDCEMSYTTAGCELTRLTIIDAEGNMIYDTLIKPDNPIIDYNTRFSGITEEDMEDVTTTIREVQSSCLTRFSDKTILIGHSLESDLHALKIIHDTVIDTSVIFPHKMGPPFKRALRNLASEYLKRIIQEDVSGHDSKEDAVAAMDLVHWKVREDLKVNTRST